MKIILSLFLLLILTPRNAGAFSMPEDRAKNESLIKYELYRNGRSGYSMILDGACYGTLPPEALRAAKATTYRLEEGLRCAVGDFDNNGSLDFGILNGKGKDVFMVILFFSGAKVIRTNFLYDLELGPKLKGAGIGTYPMGFQGEAGEPLAPTDGLFRWRKGEPRKGFTIWFFNPKTEKMEKHLYPHQGD